MKQLNDSSYFADEGNAGAYSGIAASTITAEDYSRSRILQKLTERI